MRIDLRRDRKAGRLQFADDLIDGIERLLEYLHSEVQSVENLLRNCRACYEIQGLDCFLCGRSHPAQAKKCHPCNNAELHSKHCTVDSRVAGYFATLRQAELWPQWSHSGETQCQIWHSGFLAPTTTSDIVVEHGSVLSSKNWKNWIKGCRRP